MSKAYSTERKASPQLHTCFHNIFVIQCRHEIGVDNGVMPCAAGRKGYSTELDATTTEAVVPSRQCARFKDSQKPGLDEEFECGASAVQ